MKKVALLFFSISLVLLGLGINNKISAAEVCEGINPKEVTQGGKVTYTFKFPEMPRRTYYFVKSWDRNNKEVVSLDDQGVLQKDFSAPTSPGANYNVYLEDPQSPGSLRCLVYLKVIELPPGTPIPTPLPTSIPPTPIPTPTQSPDIIKNCPVCPEGYFWYWQDKTCYDYSKKKGDKDYYKEPAKVDCSSTGNCSIGCGCDPISCLSKPDPNITPVCVGGLCATAVGPIPTNPAGLVTFVLRLILYLSGGIALILIIIGGYQMMTSQGNPERLQGARETITSAIVGLLFIIFSLVLLEVIGVDILQIPGFER